MDVALSAPPKHEDAAFASGSTAHTNTNGRLYLPPPLRAPELAAQTEMKQLYWDRSHYESHEAQIAALKKSSTLYVGNLAFTTSTRHIMSHFRGVGPVKQVHLGLDRIKKTPCGFCFVEYERRRHALAAVSVLSGTKLDGSIIRVELDAGFQQGRQYGRGAKGGQVRHDRKNQGLKRSRGPSESQPQDASQQPSANDGGASSYYEASGEDNAAAATTGAGIKTEEGTDDVDDMGDGPAAKRRRM